MIKNRLPLMIALMLLVTITSASAILDSDVLFYYTFDTADLTGGDPDDVTGNGYDGTANGAVPETTGIINNDFFFEGTNDEVNTGGLTGVKAISIWFEPDGIISTSAPDGLFGELSGFPQLEIGGNIKTPIYDEMITYKISATDDYWWNATQFGASSFSAAYHHLVLTWNSTASNYMLYFDGDNKGVAAKYGTPTEVTAFTNFEVGKSGADALFFDGDIDELAVFTEELTPSDVAELWNGGTGRQYPFPVISDNFSLTVIDSFSSLDIDGLNVTVNGSDFNGVFRNATGNYVNTSILQNASYTYNITISGTNHFSREYLDYNVSSNLIAELHGSDIKLNATELLTLDAVSPLNFTINGTTKENDESFYLPEGTYNVIAHGGDGYFNQTGIITVDWLDNKTETITGLFNAILNVTGVDSWSGDTINVFNLTVEQANFSFSSTVTTATGNYSFGVIKDYNYTATITPSTSDYLAESDSFIVNTTKYNYTFTLDPYNSVNITFKHYNDTVITEEINATIISSTGVITNTTTTGNILLSLLSPDSYELRTEAASFDDRKYFFIVTDQSTQTITVYLTLNSSLELQVFQLLDTTNADVTGAILRVERETTTGANLWTNYAEEESNAEGKVNVLSLIHI